MYEENGAYVCKQCWEYTKEDLTPVSDFVIRATL